MASQTQPAIKSYFFGKGYADLKHTILDTWQANLESAGRYNDKARDLWGEGAWQRFGSVALSFAALAVVVFGSIWFLILSLLHITILSLFFLLIYLCFSLVLLVERGYMLYNRIFTACPYCHHKFNLPIYLCSNGSCRKQHTHLTSGSYGILKRICDCGTKLPAVFFNGRSELEAHCPNPNCGRNIETRETRPICIPIIGGPSVGKTCYLIAATRALVKDIAPANNWQIEFLNPQTETIYENMDQRFKSGIAPDKTTDLQAQAFNFFIKSSRFSPDKVLYFYDAAGEVFERSENLGTHKFFGYLHGFLFLIDPFSIPELVARIGPRVETQRDQLKPSSKSLEDTYDAMLINLEKNHRIKRDQPVKKPCAVVINKLDAFDLETRLGPAASSAYQATHNLKTEAEATDRLCREFLGDLGLGNLMRKLELKFKKHRFFTCSALGHGAASNHRAFTPYRVEQPLLWLLAQADRDLRI